MVMGRTPKRKKYGTIQVDLEVKEQIIDYCDQNDLKIGRFIQRLFLFHVSGSALTNEIINDNKDKQ